jgi:hypothetical protein
VSNKLSRRSPFQGEGVVDLRLPRLATRWPSLVLVAQLVADKKRGRELVKFLAAL